MRHTGLLEVGLELLAGFFDLLGRWRGVVLTLKSRGGKTFESLAGGNRKRGGIFRIAKDISAVVTAGLGTLRVAIDPEHRINIDVIDARILCALLLGPEVNVPEHARD